MFGYKKERASFTDIKPSRAIFLTASFDEAPSLAHQEGLKNTVHTAELATFNGMLS